MNEKSKIYNQLNEATIKVMKHDYREKNKEILKRNANQPHECECGWKYTNSSKAKHLKTSKHLAYNKNKV
jgi:hypothetical protein